MTDTTPVTSDAKLCVDCGAAFGEKDDGRYKQCAACRNPEGVSTVDPSVVAATADMVETEGAGEKPLKLDVKRVKPAPRPPTKFYSLGVTQDCPWSYITAGGVNFQKTHGEVRDRPGQGGQECIDNVDIGAQIHQLTDKHIALVLENVANRVVRNYRVSERELFDGSTVKTVLGTMKTMEGSPNRPFVAQDSDRPLGEFLWIVQVRHKTDRLVRIPPTLVPRQ